MKPSSSFQNPMSDDTDKNMDELFQNVKSENYDSSFDEFDFWFRKKTLNNQSNQTMKNSFNLKYFLSHNRIKLAIIAFLLLTIAACNMPVTSTNTSGYLLSWSTARDRAASMLKETKALNTENKYEVFCFERGENEKQRTDFNMIMENVTESQVEAMKKNISSLNGVTNMRVTPMITSETLPLYSYAMKNLLKIDVNREGKTDEEVAIEIQKQLESAGYQNVKIRFENKDGKKRWVLDEGSVPEGGNLEINVDGKNQKEVIKMKKIGPGEGTSFEGMTDEQIREQVKKDNPGVQDKDITIERTIGKDGKPEVKIKVERDEEVTK